mmetsp:Transcript_8786/g.14779  ORF Transcript_8786/g.14779 Transcript_8786/m.14779 type:complete len:162 (-) Transcript_8786:356-841(-)|eukprot:CAMPEP_0116544680 /NCGR_PEP_ID=MMETSP0397-20121206/2249_1 /TAXON_ID=216820 /ORGANISM="Cyclophora tenuis, Strain ECT3854" /LENGTH=161 /DNA_ID=CAMNT_0004068913 /DNA_START=99 /DNA_END=584 /DNA_ORIENTATION=-
MGRRAKKAPVQTKKRAKLAKRFKCPFCANEDVVECKMDLKDGVGSLECRLCGASYQMPIHHLHEPIDVFSEWLDDCEAAQQGRAPDDDPHARPPDDDDVEDDDDNNLGQASGLSRSGGGGGGAEQNGSTASAVKQPAAGATSGQPSYSALGLDDSDESDDE